jgi:hypothetical protein
MLDFNKIMKKMSWQDVGIVKFIVFFFTLFLVNFIPQLLEVDWRIWGILWIIPWLYLMHKIFIKK